VYAVDIVTSTGEGKVIIEWHVNQLICHCY
jgi:hypothetical protein